MIKTETTNDELMAFSGFSFIVFVVMLWHNCPPIQFLWAAKVSWRKRKINFIPQKQQKEDERDDGEDEELTC